MQLIIEPIKEGDYYPYTKITYKIDPIQEKELCRIPVTMHSIPAAKYNDFTITDTLGNCNYTTNTINEYPYDYIGVYPSRELIGEVVIEYKVIPRKMDETCKCGPYLDFRYEEGGINAGGESFLLKFKQLEGTTKLIWKNIQGVCGYGEGNITRIGNINDFRDTYYAFGDLHQYQQDDFHFYYFKKPSFDVDEIARFTASLYLLMKKFFHDPEVNYAVFLRKDPFTHSGGSALKRSYMLGYNDTEEVTLENQKNILAHELVHNYPHLLDDPYGIGTWYEEGIAEYYSVLLPLRANLITLEEALYEIQKRSDSYYSNPMNTIDNLTIGRTCWEDHRRQTIPYGRGFFYLGHVDVLIKEKTKYKYSLDDIVFSLIERERNHLSITNQDFLDLVQQIALIDLTAEFESMCKGELFSPDPHSFDDHFDYQVNEGKYSWYIKR